MSITNLSLFENFAIADSCPILTLEAPCRELSLCIYSGFQVIAVCNKGGIQRVGAHSYAPLLRRMLQDHAHPQTAINRRFEDFHFVSPARRNQDLRRVSIYSVL